MDFSFLGFKKRGGTIDDKTPEKMTVELRDIIAPSYIGISQNSIKLGEKIAKSYFIFSYPRYLNTGWLSPIINLNVPLDISFFIHPVSSQLILKKLRSKITQV